MQSGNRSLYNPICQAFDQIIYYAIHRGDDVWKAAPIVQNVNKFRSAPHNILGGNAWIRDADGIVLERTFDLGDHDYAYAV